MSGSSHKIAILSDIHANLPALNAVLRDVEQSGAGRIVFLGDIVGYGASPAECVDRVRTLGGECVIGNHDFAIKRVRMRGRKGMSPGWEKSPYFAGLVHAAKALDCEQALWLDSLPFTLRIPGGVIAHANLHQPESFESILEPDFARRTLEKVRGKSPMIGFCGHTHISQLVGGGVRFLEFEHGGFHVPADVGCVVGVGSVGWPLYGADLRAAWVIWDFEKRVVERRKTSYDYSRAGRMMLDAGLPMESAIRLLAEFR